MEEESGKICYLNIENSSKDPFFGIIHVIHKRSEN